jgi:hypothetical protein
LKSRTGPCYSKTSINFSIGYVVVVVVGTSTIGSNCLGKALCKWKTAEHNKERFLLVEGQSQKSTEVQRHGTNSDQKWGILSFLARQVGKSKPQKQLPRAILFCKK